MHDLDFSGLVAGTKKPVDSVSEGIPQADFAALWRCLSVLPNMFGLWAGAVSAARRLVWLGPYGLANTALQPVGSRGSRPGETWGWLVSSVR